MSADRRCKIDETSQDRRVVIIEHWLVTGEHPGIRSSCKMFVEPHDLQWSTLFQFFIIMPSDRQLGPIQRSEVGRFFSDYRGLIGEDDRHQMQRRRQSSLVEMNLIISERSTSRWTATNEIEVHIQQQLLPFFTWVDGQSQPPITGEKFHLINFNFYFLFLCEVYGVFKFCLYILGFYDIQYIDSSSGSIHLGISE